MLKSAHSVGEKRCVKGTACVSEMACVRETSCVEETLCVEETPCMEEARCVRETACVRDRYVREMTVGMWEHATACPSVMVRCVSVVAHGSACVKWRRRQTKDKGRVAAVAISRTAPGLHSSEREVHAVLRTRPPRARLRE